jgi:hypothetical protein
MLIATAEQLGHAMALFLIIVVAIVVAAWFVAPFFRSKK